jgi:hypothetical protein
VAVGADLQVGPRNQLTGATRRIIRQHKAVLLAFLRQRMEEEAFILFGIEADQGLPPGSLSLWRP